MILESGEHVLLEVRKHWFLLFIKTWFLPVLAVLPMAAFLVIATSNVQIPFTVTMDHVWLIVFFYLLWILILWLVAFVIWTDYYLDAWFITYRRVIDIDQKGIFAREVSSLPFERIQDVTTDVSGPVATLLNFGTMSVQSAGDKREFYMRGARKPYECKDVILDQRQKVRQEPERVTIADDGEDSNDGDDAVNAERRGNGRNQ